MIWGLDQINIISEIELKLKKNQYYLYLLFLREISQFINMEGINKKQNNKLEYLNIINFLIFNFLV